MKTKTLILILTGFTLLIPSVAATYPTTNATYASLDYHSSSIYQADIEVQNNDNLINKTYILEPTHDYEIVAGKILLTIHATITGTGTSTGFWQYQAYHSNVAITGCVFVLRTEGSAINPIRFGGTFELPCEVPVASPYATTTETIRITQTIQSGTPTAPIVSSTGVRIDRQDQIMIPQDQNEILGTFQVFAPLIIGTILLIAAKREEFSYIALLLYGAAFLGFVGSVLTLPAEYAAIRVLLVALILYIAAQIIALRAATRSHD